MSGWLATLLAGEMLSAAAAPAPDPIVAWDAPSACAEASTVDLALSTLLGDDWRQRADPGLSVSVEIVRARAASKWTLSVEVRRPDGTWQRTLSDASCEALAEVGVLMVALAIHPELAVGEGDRALLQRLGADSRESLERGTTPPTDGTPSTSPSDSETPPRPIQEARAPESEPPEPRRAPSPSPWPPRERLPWRAALTLRGVVGFGMLPTVEGGPAAGAALILPRARFEVDTRGWFGPRVDVASDASVAFSGWTIGLRGGPRWTVGPVAFPVMLGTEAGQLIARPTRLEGGTTRRPAWVAISIAAAAVVSPLERLGFFMSVEGFVSVTRPPFEVEGLDESVHTPAAGGVRGILGVEARFP
jgi:hypothetical protein